MAITGHAYLNEGVGPDVTIQLNRPHLRDMDTHGAMDT